MKNLLRRAGLALLACAPACTAASHQSAPLPAQDVIVTSPELARIYFVREDSPGLRRNELVVTDDTTEIGVLTPSTFLCWERRGGRTLGHASYKAIDPKLGRVDGLIDLDCPAGQAYYFNVAVRREDGKPEIERLDPAHGRELVAQRSWAGQR